MGERYDRILRGIVPFRATVRAARPAFKLGQDERDDVYTDILAGLEADGEAGDGGADADAQSGAIAPLELQHDLAEMLAALHGGKGGAGLGPGEDLVDHRVNPMQVERPAHGFEHVARTH